VREDSARAPGRCDDASQHARTRGMKFRRERRLTQSFRAGADAGDGGLGMLDVRAAVVNALHWQFAIPRHKVTAKVDDGLVTLKGRVDWPYQKALAEAVVRRVPGVVTVRNEIAIPIADAADEPIPPPS
jgi:osmotically-inducible protein OsmY